MPADDGLHGMPAEDLAAFLHDLRALREREGLSLEGLAARADIPPDTLAAAENGPVRPAMPVLEAYVRGCGDATEPWRGRWHGLASGTSTGLADPQQPAAAPPAGQPEFAVTRLGPRPGRCRPSPALAGTVAAAVALAGLAAGGAFLLSRPAGHGTASAPAAPSRGDGRSMAATGGRMPMRMRTVTPGPAQPSAVPSRPGLQRARMPGRGRVPRRVPAPGQIRPTGVRLEVAGVGCPHSQGDGVSLDAASAGPAWSAAGGGWTGNGCDGSSVWTMDPNGNQPSPSTLTWFFHPSAGESVCRLDVFVPTQNALGVASYAISDGGVSLGGVPVDQAASAASGPPWAATHWPGACWTSSCCPARRRSPRPRPGTAVPATPGTAILRAAARAARGTADPASGTLCPRQARRLGMPPRWPPRRPGPAAAEQLLAAPYG